MYYAILQIYGPNDTSTYSIFRGKTLRSAINRARDNLIDDTESSRAEWEEEHGAVPDDDEWVKIMEKCGFWIRPAEFQED